MWLVTLGLALPTLASAGPIRLGEWTATLSGAGHSVSAVGPIDSLRVTISPTLGPDACVGCDTPIALGATGSWDFSRPAVADLAGLLTDGLGGMLHFLVRPHTGALPRGGSGIGGKERVAYGFNPRRANWSVDFLRLVILSNQIHVNTAHDYAYTVDARWEVWGAGKPEIPAPIPAPGAAVLFTLGTAIWVVRRQSGRRSVDTIRGSDRSR
jgi:hypothetical protein